MQFVGINGLCLDIILPRGESVANGTPLQLYRCHNGANQLWALRSQPAAPPVLVAQAQPAVPAPAPAAPAAAPVDQVALGAVPPERVNAEIEASAKRQQNSTFNFGRWMNFRTYASDPSFTAALGNHAVMLITVLARRPEQLPLGNVFIRAGGRDVPMTKLSSWRSQIDENLPAANVYGRNREDGFYLIPITMMRQDGQILFDMNDRTGLTLLQLPSNALKGRPDPGPPVATDATGVRGFIARLFPGFPVP